MSGFPRVNEQVQRCVLCTLVWIAAATHATAQNATWIGTPGETGNWTDPTKWDSTPVPAGTAIIRNGGIAVVDSLGVGCNAIYVDGTDGRSTLRVNTGGELTISAEFNLGGHNPAGMQGTLEVNGGSFTCGDLRAGYAGGNTGIVEVTDGFLSTGYIRLGSFVSRGGTVGGSGVGIIRQSGGVINLTSSSSISLLGGPAPGEQFGQLIMTGGVLTNNYLFSVGSAAGAYGELIVSNATLVCVRNLRIGIPGTGRMEIHDGANVIMTNANPAIATFELGAASGGTGVVEMTGGYLSLLPFYVSNGGTGTFRLKGGTIKMNDYRFTMVATAGGTALFEQSDGLLDMTTAGTIYLNSTAGGASARFNISGGVLDCSSDIYISANADVGAFRVTGSQASITIRRIRNDTSTPFLLEFVLDKSLAHLSRINMTSTGSYRTGHLRVGLDGGIVLTTNNTFTLIRAAGMGLSPEYHSRPDPNMWTEALVLNVEGAIDESRITLANGYKMDDLNIRSGRAAIFEPHAMGHVTIANLDTSLMEEGLGVYMKVDAATYGKTPADLVNALVAAGYTNSTTAAAAPFDLVAVIPKAYVEDGTSYFAWDFTDVTTGATNATVNAVRFSVWPPPPGGTIVTIR